MGGEGSMAAANNSLKNNRKLLAKRKDKKVLSGSYSGAEMKSFPKSTPELLEKIKQQTLRENTNYKRKLVYITLVLMMLLALFVYYILV
ncbi:hypothetical protein PK35_06235 [Tamlana nanhaiensis]|uniref:Uncharacterized protein n=1 Tax=Neotamlana nanhaiensis TaxID=1382798 RepID=A0A0D7W2Y7_9FLAO|nr:hypothetical protein [Tamlana nanhaiensis]KJD33451.1 hypothetical protein PK35_06235 [Tamlana nanhaiensis]